MPIIFPTITCQLKKMTRVAVLFYAFDATIGHEGILFSGSPSAVRPLTPILLDAVSLYSQSRRTGPITPKFHIFQKILSSIVPWFSTIY